MLVILTLFLLIAIFIGGVYVIMTGSEKVVSINKQLADLRTRVDDLEESPEEAAAR